MSGEKWSRVRSALAQIGNEAMQYDADGIDICFLNSRVYKKSIMVSNHVTILLWVLTAQSRRKGISFKSSTKFNLKVHLPCISASLFLIPIITGRTPMGAK